MENKMEKETNENETVETVSDEYTVPEWWTNSYGRSNRSYWD